MELSPLEKKVLLLVRTLKPHEWVEIKNKEGKIVIIVHSTVKEEFAIDAL